MDALTPLQCFIAGLVGSLLCCSALGLLGWRQLRRLKARNPDHFADLDGEAWREKELKASRDEEEFHWRRREVELLERLVENQEVMIGLLRQSLDEKALS